LLLSAVKDARMAVMVVPMLAPRVSGYMRSMCTTPTPTRGVNADVKMDELCKGGKGITKTTTCEQSQRQGSVSLRHFGGKIASKVV
jgi:hypothetical protein